MVGKLQYVESCVGLKIIRLRLIYVRLPFMTLHVTEKCLKASSRCGLVSSLLSKQARKKCQ